MNNLEIIKDRSQASINQIDNQLNIEEFLNQEFSIYPGTCIKFDEVINPKTVILKDFEIYFEIKGDLNGYAIASLNQKQFKEEDLNFVNGIFIENINILLGKILTDIDLDKNLMSVISNPLRLKIELQDSDYQNNIMARYILNFRDKDYPLYLKINTRINKTKVV